MEDIDFWRIPDHFSIVQAALLACGCDPQDLQHTVENNLRNRPKGYIAIRTALFNAVRSDRLETECVEYERDEHGCMLGLDLHRTLISVADLDNFFRARGIACEIFNRNRLEVAGQLSPDHPQFPLKLGAAIKAWTAVTSDPSTLRGKSPKQALAKWLTDNAKELGLLNKDGGLNTTGIEEICKVANWKPGGGATPTPGREFLAQPPALMRLPAPREQFIELDDEIPF